MGVSRWGTENIKEGIGNTDYQCGLTSQAARLALQFLAFPGCYAMSISLSALCCVGSVASAWCASRATSVNHVEVLPCELCKPCNDC